MEYKVLTEEILEEASKRMMIKESNIKKTTEMITYTVDGEVMGPYETDILVGPGYKNRKINIFFITEGKEYDFFREVFNRSGDGFMVPNSDSVETIINMAIENGLVFTDGKISLGKELEEGMITELKMDSKWGDIFKEIYDGENGDKSYFDEEIEIGDGPDAEEAKRLLRDYDKHFEDLKLLMYGIFDELVMAVNDSDEQLPDPIVRKLKEYYDKYRAKYFN